MSGNNLLEIEWPVSEQSSHRAIGTTVLEKNPADIPSRGMTPLELSQNSLWLNGPIWLQNLQEITELLDSSLVMPKECQRELKAGNVINMLNTIEDQRVNIAEVINCEQFSSAFRLLKTTALSFQAVRNFLAKIGRTCQVIPNNRASDFDQARIIWLRQMQSQLQECSKFSSWKQQFDLFVDESNLWRCGG